jgi:hypothetical protein
LLVDIWINDVNFVFFGCFSMDHLILMAMNLAVVFQLYDKGNWPGLCIYNYWTPLLLFSIFSLIY